MVKRTWFVIVLLGLTLALGAQQSWEGLATVGRFGRFPAGLYGASNLVPPGSLVSVRNLESGESERIIITDGVDEPGVFLVLSPESAALLDITGSGATRVRLTSVVTQPTPVDAASEQPFHPDPDINPAAGVSPDDEMDLAALPPEEEPVAEEAPAAVAEATEDADGEPADVPTAEPAEPAQLEEPPGEEVVAEPEEAPAEVEEPAEPGTRTGIAAGVARTRVGRAQESFERPEATIEAERPADDDGLSADEVPFEEPELEPQETASVGIEGPEPREETVPAVAVATPRTPSEEAAGETPEPELIEDPDEPEAAALVTPPGTPGDGRNPIKEAVNAAVNRIPARDLFPPPVGEESDLGFAVLPRPAEPDDAVALDVAQAPPVDRPELAGLAPLKAVAAELPTALAEASLPPEDLPDYAAFMPPEPPAETLVAELPVAAAAEEERPLVQDLPTRDPPSQSVEGELAEARPAEEETAEVVDFGPVKAPGGEPITTQIAAAQVQGEETPDTADVGPYAAPDDPELSPLLAAAEFVPPESPDVDSVEMVDPPVELVEGDLAVATVPETERPELSDIGTAEAPELAELEGVLAEATPIRDEVPEESLESASPGTTEILPEVATEPDVGTEEALVADEGIGQPEEIPEDAVLTLAPADFRPPEYPDPDDESLIDREIPEEEPELEVALESPEAEEPERVAEEPREEVAAEPPPEEPAELAVEPPAEEPPATMAAETAAPETVIGDLPVVTSLAGEDYYLQIGAYAAPSTAQVAVDALAATYPMAVMPVDSRGTTVYRVLVGPLEQDETGMLLLFLRSRGYRDTFIRSGTEL